MKKKEVKTTAEKRVVKLSQRMRRLLNRLHLNRKYKDRLFIMLFSDKEHLLELYNALNDSDYQDASELEITTLEDAVYLSMKNDVSFIIGNQLNLFEHQSTFCANMPVRGLLYLAEIYKGYIAANEYDIYGSRLISLPRPHYIVFYNGQEKHADVEELRLSDAFVGDNSCLEFKAIMYNINFGHNQKLMEQCRQLEEYAIFVDMIRKYQQRGDSFTDAVESAVKDCIEQNVLKQFLLKNRNEVRRVLLTEYDEKKHLKLVRRDAFEEGVDEGEDRMSILIDKLLTDERVEDLQKASKDKSYRQHLYEEYGIK